MAHRILKQFFKIIRTVRTPPTAAEVEKPEEEEEQKAEEPQKEEEEAKAKQTAPPPRRRVLDGAGGSLIFQRAIQEQQGTSPAKVSGNKTELIISSGGFELTLLICSTNI